MRKFKPTSKISSVLVIAECHLPPKANRNNYHVHSIELGPSPTDGKPTLLYMVH